MELEDVALRLEAPGNPTRVRIIRVLGRAGEGGLPFGRLQERIGIAASTLTHYRRKRIQVGLATQERRSTMLICRANYPMIRDVAGALMDPCCTEADEAGVQP